MPGTPKTAASSDSTRRGTAVGRKFVRRERFLTSQSAVASANAKGTETPHFEPDVDVAPLPRDPFWWFRRMYFARVELDGGW